MPQMTQDPAQTLAILAQLLAQGQQGQPQQQPQAQPQQQQENPLQTGVIKAIKEYNKAQEMQGKNFASQALHNGMTQDQLLSHELMAGQTELPVPNMTNQPQPQQQQIQQDILSQIASYTQPRGFIGRMAQGFQQGTGYTEGRLNNLAKAASIAGVEQDAGSQLQKVQTRDYGQRTQIEQQNSNTNQMQAVTQFNASILDGALKQQQLTGTEISSDAKYKSALVEESLARANRIKNSLNPEKKIALLKEINDNLEESGLGDYQATESTDGDFLLRPKSGGALAQMEPGQIEAISDSLLSGNITPSQLPRSQRAQVISATLAKDPSYNAAKADINFAVNKMGAGNFEKLYNNVVSFERTFRKNADVALKLSDGFDRSKIPLINRAIIAGKMNITGDPEATRIAAALNTVANEYARLTTSPGASGSVISDTARAEARRLLNEWQNKGTIRGLLDPEFGIMSIDAQNRVDALNETRDEIRGRYEGGVNDSKPSDTRVKSKTITLPSGKTITIGGQ